METIRCVAPGCNCGRLTTAGLRHVLAGQRILNATLAESLTRDRNRRQYQKIPRRPDGKLILTERERPMLLAVQLPNRNKVVVSARESRVHTP